MSTDAARTRTSPGALAGAVIATIFAAAVPCIVLFDFTVDDALIIARVADHVSKGAGCRFNANGPIVDAVTPLGFAHMVSVFGGSGPESVLRFAKWMGLFVWLSGAGWLATMIAREGTSYRRFAVLPVLAACGPMGAWAVAGMETGIVAALATVALARHPAGAVAAGLAAGWRPELLPWAVALSASAGFATGGSSPSISRIARVAIAIAIAVAPAAAAGLVRSMVFGMSTPLAALAKPADLRLGIAYAISALAFTGPAWLVASRELSKLDGHHRAILVASAVHLVAVAVAGGDWMPMSRLLVPVLPGWLLVGAAVAERAPLWATSARVAVALAACAKLWISVGADGAHVGATRGALIEAARGPLSGAERIAAADVGWVGAATSATIVDLAGVTDPTIAVLSGSHTSKLIPKTFLTDRRIDAAVILGHRDAGGTFVPARSIDARLLGLVERHGGFEALRAIDLDRGGFTYMIFRMKRDAV